LHQKTNIIRHIYKLKKGEKENEARNSKEEEHP
jgi:hypothetical protein